LHIRSKKKLEETITILSVFLYKIYSLFPSNNTDQWFPKCGPQIPSDTPPVPRGSVGEFI